MEDKINADDAQTIAAIASEFMTDQRYATWYEKNCDRYGGTPGIWAELAQAGVYVATAEQRLRVIGFDWGNFEYMEAVFSVVDVLYKEGFVQDWTKVLLNILIRQHEAEKQRQGGQNNV